MTERTQVILRLDPALIEAIDDRLNIVNAGRDKKVSRNDWFANMAKWVINELPHHAVKSDLIDAWADLPEDTLGFEARHWHRRDEMVQKNPDGTRLWRCTCGKEWWT